MSYEELSQFLSMLMPMNQLGKRWYLKFVVHNNQFEHADPFKAARAYERSHANRLRITGNQLMVQDPLGWKRYNAYSTQEIEQMAWDTVNKETKAKFPPLYRFIDLTIPNK